MQTLKKKTAPLKGKGTKTVNFNPNNEAEIKAHNEMVAAMKRPGKKGTPVAEVSMPSYAELLERVTKYETQSATMISKLRAQYDDPDHLKKMIRSSETTLMHVVDDFQKWDLMSNVIEEVGHWFSAYVGNPQQPWNEEPRGQTLSNQTFEYVRLITFLSKISEIFNERVAHEAQLKISNLVSE